VRSEKKYPDQAALVKATLKADTTFTVIEENAGSDWIHIREKELTRSVKREWLEYHDDKAVKGDEHYTPKREYLANVSKAFDSLELTVTSKLKLIAKDGEKNRKVRYIVPEGEAERYWVKRSLLGEIEDNTVTTKTDIPECFRQNPEAITFYKQSGKTAEDLFIKIDGIEKAQDEEKNLWYHIKNQAVDGWICDGDTENLKMLSAFDWPGFSIQKEAGDAAYDPMIDFKNLSPFFKRIVDEINTDRDKAFITNEELKKAVKDEKIAYRLSRLICFHQSEWWVDRKMKYWESVFRKIGSKQAELQKEVFRNTCWWDEVSQKCKDFLPTPNVYHWHPVAFVENMRNMHKEPEWLTFAENEAKRWKGETEDVISKTINYHKEVGIKLTDLIGTDHAWCASFVNYCLKCAGYNMFSPACRAKAVQDDLNFVKIEKPVLGSIGLVGTHHVGFVYAQNEGNTRPILLGGNQSDQINFTTWKEAVSFYLPKEYYKQTAIETDLPFSTSDKLNEEFGIILNKKIGDIYR